MPLILRKCKSDGSSSYDFKYGNAGNTVEAPDWKPTAQCGNGLHGLLEASGDWNLLVGCDWMVIEANEEEDVIKIDKKKCKFKKGRILYRGEKEGLEQFIPKFKLKSDSAYRWAKNIGNKEEMIKFIDNAEDAYRWAKDISDREEMIKFINNSKYAFLWARDIGNYDQMIKLIDNSYDAYYWALYIGNREEMIKLIDNSHDAFNWAFHFGNEDQMIKFIKNAEDAYIWAKHIGNQEEMIEKFPEINKRLKQLIE